MCTDGDALIVPHFRVDSHSLETDQVNDVTGHQGIQRQPNTQHHDQPILTPPPISPPATPALLPQTTFPSSEEISAASGSRSAGPFTRHQPNFTPPPIAPPARRAALPTATILPSSEEQSVASGTSGSPPAVQISTCTTPNNPAFCKCRAPLKKSTGRSSISFSYNRLHLPCKSLYTLSPAKAAPAVSQDRHKTLPIPCYPCSPYPS